MSISGVKLQISMNVGKVQELVSKLHPIVQDSVQANRSEGRCKSSKGMLPRFMEGDYVLVAREEFTAGEKLFLRWRGPRGGHNALSNYVFQVEDLLNGVLQDVHGSRLTF